MSLIVLAPVDRVPGVGAELDLDPLAALQAVVGGFGLGRSGDDLWRRPRSGGRSGPRYRVSDRRRPQRRAIRTRRSSSPGRRKRAGPRSRRSAEACRRRARSRSRSSPCGRCRERPARPRGRRPRSRKGVLRAAARGEEFELLFTLPEREVGKLLKEFPRLTKTKVTPIGRVVRERDKLVSVDGQGKERPIIEAGYDHFKVG